MNDFISALKSMTPNAVMDYIRTELSKDGERVRFDMSGYDTTATMNTGDGKQVQRFEGTCTVHNQKVLNTFAHLGIYDYTAFIFLDFSKGLPTFYWCYWGEEGVEKAEFGGYSTSHIIYEIFQRTILSDRPTRRRY